MSLSKVNACILFIICLAAVFVCACSGGDDDDAPDDDDAGDDDASDDDAQDDDTGDDDQPPGPFAAGFAKVDVTPETIVKLAGYGTFFLSEDNCRWSTDVHDPLFAQAAAFDDPASGRAVIIIVLDNVGMMIEPITRIKLDVARATGIDPGGVIISSTHTHHGPDTIGLWGVLLPPISGMEVKALERMIAGAVKAGRSAWESRVPAKLSFASGQQEELHVNIIWDDPQRLLDDTMTVVAAHDLEDNLLGTVMNWGCHPTVMGQKSTVISSDFAGVYYRRMNEDLGGAHLFLNGAVGASVQPYNRWQAPDRWDQVELMGEGVVQTAQQLLSDLTPIDRPSISMMVIHHMDATLDNIVFYLASRLGLIEREIPQLGQTAWVPLVSFKIGPVAFGTMPGEFVPDYAFRLREIMGGQAQVLIGLGADYIGYAMTPQQYENPAYLYERLLCAGQFVGEELVAAYNKVWTEEPDGF